MRQNFRKSATGRNQEMKGRDLSAGGGLFREPDALPSYAPRYDTRL